MLQHIDLIASIIFGCIPEGCVFLLLCSRCFFVNFYWFFCDLWIWRIMVNLIVIMKIQPSLCLDDWGKPRKNTQSDWSAPWLKPGTSRIRVLCITTAPPHSVRYCSENFLRRTVHCFFFSWAVNESDPSHFPWNTSGKLGRAEWRRVYPFLKWKLLYSGQWMNLIRHGKS